MKLSRYFEPSRFWLLLKMEIFRSRKGYLITFVVTFGLLFTGFILENLFGSREVFESHAAGYTFFLLAGGFILSSLSFHDLGNPLKRYHYLALPASTLEKFLSMWFLTCIGWIVMFTLTFIIYALMANSIGHMFFRNTTFMAFEPLAEGSLNAIRFYVVFQVIFLVGAVHFRSYVFPKTIFTLMLFAMLCGIIFYIIMADIIHSDIECTAACNPLQDKTLMQFWTVVQWLVMWLMAPLGWIITFIGLREQEV